MSHIGRILGDGRNVIASYDDLLRFFEVNQIVGRKIKEIYPLCHDYMIKDMGELYPFDVDFKVPCGIETDGFICLVFEDGEELLIEIPGEAPIILGISKSINKRKKDGTCYSLNTMFGACIGKTISDIRFDRTNHRMLFPIYQDIDMSNQDEGINEMRIILEDNSQLVFYGWQDFFKVDYRNEEDEVNKIRFASLVSDLNMESKLKYGIVKPSDCIALSDFYDKLSKAIKDRNQYTKLKNIDIPFVLSVMTQAIESNIESYINFIIDIDKYAGYGIEISENPNKYNSICDVFINIYTATCEEDEGFHEPAFSYVFSFEYDERYLGYCECQAGNTDYREDKKCCGHGCDWTAPSFTFYKKECIAQEVWQGDQHDYWEFEDSYYAIDKEEAEKKRIRDRAEEMASLEDRILELQKRLDKLKSEQ